MKSVSDSLASRLVCAAVLALAAWAAGAASTATQAAELLILDRSAVGRGELWRLWTGHLVHGSWTHFAYDVGAAVLLCLAFGRALRLLWMAPLLSVGLLVALPDVQHYYGLSGLLHAWVVTALADVVWRERGPRARLAAALLAGTIGKAALETALGTSLFTMGLDFGGPVLHASHLAGALVGLVGILAGAIANVTRAPRTASRPAAGGPLSLEREGDPAREVARRLTVLEVPMPTLKVPGLSGHDRDEPVRRRGLRQVRVPCRRRRCHPTMLSRAPQA